jgi:hypothetical protein
MAGTTLLRSCEVEDMPTLKGSLLAQLDATLDAHGALVPVRSAR